MTERRESCKTNPRMVTLFVKVRTDHWAALQDAALREGRMMSELLNDVLKSFVRRHREEEERRSAN